MRALRVAVVAVALSGVPAAAHAQLVPTPTDPPATEPPATEPPAPTPTPAPVTTSPPKATTPPTTRARTTVTRARGTTTTGSSTSTSRPGPTTTIFVIPGEAVPTSVVGTTTIATIPQNDDIPTWATNLFWIGVAGVLAIIVTTFVMTGRNA